MSQDYKNTLNLPRTGFPMKAGLTAREPQMLQTWENERLYERIQESRKDAPLFVMHDGPPFANGDVHMGTALNKILKDFVVKSKTMAGFRAPFVPGWDCHGLPIEFKVIRESKGLSPLEIREKSADYARKYIDLQRTQFRRLGVFADWTHPYLTLDPAYEAEMLRAFAVFVEKGLVYRSKKPVLWSYGAQTALAEAEVEYRDKESPAIHVAFPVLRGPLPAGSRVVIWTTTPWTLPANLAIAVHPGHEYLAGRFHHPHEDRREVFVLARERVPDFSASTGWHLEEELAVLRGSDLVGTVTAHPFLPREAPVLTAAFVTMDTGTGCVHIAPGHGADDYHLGREHGLPLLCPVDDHGRFTAEAGLEDLTGMLVFEANPRVVALLKEHQALVGLNPYQHSYPHCWRSKTPVLFRTVEQFFIRIDDLRAGALEAVAGTRWLPEWGVKRITGTVESRPDWCISRQRSWGVPLPAFYGPDGGLILEAGLIRRVAEVFAQHGSNAWFSLSDAEWSALLGLPSGSTRGRDTLDVWIDSGLSHQAVLRKHPALTFPADLYLEATDQHRGWFQSSLITSVALEGRSPYRTCLTHGFVVDVDTREKLSKSKQGQAGYSKPTDAGHFVQQHGADLVRLWVASVDFTDDVPFSGEMFTRLSDTYRRIRNTLRILLGNLDGFDPARHAVGEEGFTMVDRWILGRLDEVISTCREAYERFEFHRVHQTLNQFCAVDLSSLYIDITKDRLYCDAADSPRRRASQTVMHRLFSALARLLAPVLSFTAEEAWGFFQPGSSVHLQFFPEPSGQPLVEASEARDLLRWRSLIAQALETARRDGVLQNNLEASVRLTLASEEQVARWTPRLEEMEEFFILSELHLAAGGTEAAEVTPTTRARCVRCWRHRPDVGESPSHPGLCGRCAQAVAPSPTR